MNLSTDYTTGICDSNGTVLWTGPEGPVLAKKLVYKIKTNVINRAFSQNKKFSRRFQNEGCNLDQELIKEITQIGSAYEYASCY